MKQSTPTLPPVAAQLIEGKNFAHLATLMKDGSPQVTPVWVDRDGDFVLVNTAEGRVKQRNITRDSRVALSLYDETNPYRKAIIRGRVVAQTWQGAEAHIRTLAKKYMGRDDFPLRPGEVRVILKIQPERVVAG